MKVLVAGGGIAGLAHAIALAHRGHAVTLLERRLPGQGEGAGVILWPQAVRVLAALDALGPVAARAAVLAGLARRGLDGVVRETFDFRGGPDHPLAIRRAHLIAALQSEAHRRGVVLRFGTTVAEVAETGGPDREAVLVTADGRRWAADLVVGAEGRGQAVVGRHVRGLARVDHGLVSWVGWAVGIGDRLAQVAVDVWGDAARFGVVPCGDGEAYWAATVRATAADGGEPWRRTVVTAMPDATGLVQAVLAATDEAHVHRHRLFDLEPGGPWSLGRLVLVGDAAHAGLPTTGQGAAEALRDAESLAEVLPPVAAFDALQRGLDRFVRAREADAYAVLRSARAVSARIFGDPRQAG